LFVMVFSDLARGKRLRIGFDLSEDSPLKWRRLRNTFEHFDEDLDRFLLADRVGYFFPGPIVGSHELADEDLANIFKLIDPDKGICVVLGQKLFGPRCRKCWPALRRWVFKDLPFLDPVVMRGRLQLKRALQNPRI
jgi:hypothetical protein